MQELIRVLNARVKQEALVPTNDLTVKPALLKRRGCVFKGVTPGHVLTHVRDAMLEHSDSHSAARAVNMHTKNFIIIKRLLILSDKTTLPIEERRKIETLLAVINKQCCFYGIKREINEVLSKNWTNSPSKKDTGKDRKRFDMTVINVASTCNVIKELTVPHNLSAIQRDAAIASLMTSVVNISHLVRRLVGETEEEDENV